MFKSSFACLCVFAFLAVLGGCTTTNQQVAPAPQMTASEQTQTLIRLGDKMLEAGDTAAALGFYERAVQESPMNEDVNVTFARHLMAHDLTKADDFLADAVTRSPTPRLYNWYGVSLDLNGKHPQAQEAYRRGLEIEKTVSLQNNLALSYAVTGQFERAGEIFDDIIKDEPESILYHKNRAINLILAGDVAAAKADLQPFMRPLETNELVAQYQGQAGKKSPLELLRMVNGL